MSKYNDIKISPSLTSKLLANIDYNVVSEIKVRKDFTYSIMNNSNLDVLNRELVSSLFSKIPLNNSCVGFVKNKSYLDLLEPHRFSTKFTRLDISSFFHSISLEDIKLSIEPYIKPKFLDKNKKISSIEEIMKAITYAVPEGAENVKFRGETVLPMGFSSSPIISNIVFRKIDVQIHKYCNENNIIYTRYADDMLFSSNSELVSQTIFINKIRSLVCQLSLKINERKTITTSGHISLNGYVIDGRSGTIRLSNQKLSRINKITHQLLVRGRAPSEVAKKLYGYSISKYDFKFGYSPEFFEQYCKDQLHNKIAGNRSYLISVLKFNEQYECICPKYVTKSQVMLERLNKILDNWS
ncbi:reverse transcriptase domain-containing protein [Vibrio apostichopi]|uniref:reverse transcriptase domain-containing protein n=1 Tax=Vibrio apostichopi TaxID=3035453 RepID=UPI002574183A|nr:reverse transcriptase domain-containing protein [Vibrio sp. FE10]